jgi:hypothetical protein
MTTGHSLGASLAQLCAMYLIHDNIATSMINFGAFKVGDDNYSKFSNSVFKE